MESEITVTHFINPHLFWFKTSGEDDPDYDHVLSSLEQNLEQLYKNKPSFDNQLRPQIGDKVAVNYIARNKFIRAEVLQKAEFQQEEYIVWAIDYGFPLLTKKEYLRHLPSNLREDFGHIRVGGIANVYPAEQEYDDEEGNLTLLKKDKWLQRTCNMLEKLLTDSTSIRFVLRFEQSSNNHNWGNLTIFNHRGKKINAIDFLLKTTNAVKEEDELIFKEKCNKLSTTKIAPWLSNDRNTKMKFNTIKHNYAEHSEHIMAKIIDEQAKRKVEDWQKRNEIGASEEFTEIPDPIYIEADNNAHVDDITFDDSVSVVQDRNYIGKAGAITKNKQRIQLENKDLSPSLLHKAFQMDDIAPLERNVNNFPQPSESSLSTSTSISKRMQKLALLRSSIARTKERKNNVMASESSMPQSSALEKNENSSIASSSIRHQKLLEMRRKTANMAKQSKITDLKGIQNMDEKQNLCTTESSIKTEDSISYHLLDHSTNLSTSNTASVKKMGARDLGTIESGSGTSTTTSKNSATESIMQKVKAQEKFEIKGNDKHSNNTDCELKPKGVPTQAEDFSLSEHSSTVQKKINEKLKIDQAGYDSFTLVPAGYDITKLHTYKDEKNHWHRKKTTRFDSVAHNSTTSSDDFQLSDNKNDQSFFASSDFQQTPPREERTHTTTNHFDKNSEVFKYYKQYEKSENSANIGKNLISNKMSA